MCNSGATLQRLCIVIPRQILGFRAKDLRFPATALFRLRAGGLFAMSVPAFSPKRMADQHPLQ
jgi:hypothetical protein